MTVYVDNMQMESVRIWHSHPEYLERQKQIMEKREAERTE